MMVVNMLFSVLVIDGIWAVFSSDQAYVVVMINDR